MKKKPNKIKENPTSLDSKNEEFLVNLQYMMFSTVVNVLLLDESLSQHLGSVCCFGDQQMNPLLCSFLLKTLWGVTSSR